MTASNLTSDLSDSPALPTAGEAGALPPTTARAVAPARQPSVRFLIGSLAGGNMLSTALNMVSGVVMMGLVEPAVLGLFNAIGLILLYLPFLQGGVLNGLNRELPFFVGKGDHHRVRELAAAAQAWAILLGGLSATAMLIVALWHATQGEWMLAAGWLSNVLLVLTLFYKTWYLVFTYRTSHDFAKLALASVVESFVNLALLVLVVYFNFYGMCLRAVIVAVVGTILLHVWRPVRVGPRWDLRHFKHLLRIGAPIFAVNQLFLLWTPINLTLVFHLTGVKGLGLFSVVNMAMSAMEILPSAVAQVIYPRMAEQYGRAGHSRGLLQLIWKPVLLTFLGMIPVVGVAWVLVGPVVHYVGPKYMEAVPAVQWGLLISVVASLAPVSMLFNVVRRQDLYFVAIALGMAAYFASLFWLVRDGAPLSILLTAFPLALLIGRIVYVAVCYVFVAYLRRQATAAPREDANLA